MTDGGCRFGPRAKREMVDRRDLGTALTAEPAFGLLVALGVVGVLARVQRSLEQRPPQILRPMLGQRSAGVGGAGLLDPRAQSRVAAQRQ